jgi:hypothetical protein
MGPEQTALYEIIGRVARDAIAVVDDQGQILTRNCGA